MAVYIQPQSGCIFLFYKADHLFNGETASAAALLILQQVDLLQLEYCGANLVERSKADGNTGIKNKYKLVPAFHLLSQGGFAVDQLHHVADLRTGKNFLIRQRPYLARQRPDQRHISR